ncbi:GNAT family N-acetyltransferase [uncultured Brevundimonas sp.]|uniref:GNAT family N-acetyltransferase n=1 Tax=uncultured Brevundimonas sp. TaxID=213418 RepID=UPI002604BC2B|nr:GNAT family N-acetyltransferase [uncultured Brevundimonas sp.]
MSDYVIRPAEDRDLDALSAFSRRTFVETFVDGFGIPYPADDLEAFFQKSFSPEALRPRIHDNDCVFWIAERDGQIIALCHAGPNDLPHEDAKAGEMELRRLYVGKEAQGLGLGTELLKRALAWMEERTAGALWIGVWSGNLKAQKLYAAYGFEKVGGYGYPVGEWIDQEFILRRAV